MFVSFLMMTSISSFLCYQKETQVLFLFLFLFLMVVLLFSEDYFENFVFNLFLYSSSSPSLGNCC